MLFSDQQSNHWQHMLAMIQDFRKGKIQYSNLVYGLEGSLDAGEFKNKELIGQWYDFWTPLEILSATKGNDTTIQDADGYLSSMEEFLMSKLGQD